MDNLIYFAVVLLYGILMSVWFFARKIIQPSLVLALVTHNPFQYLLVIYVISFVCLKYGLTVFTATNLLIGLIFYLPALAWEISRKIKAPQDENQYTTYSKIFGYKTAVVIALVTLGLQFAVIYPILLPLSALATGVILLAYITLLVRSLEFIHNPRAFKYGPTVQLYMYVTQTVLLIAAGWLLYRSAA
jgi:4-hydroxybenzoate polyprenyltransferase